MSGSSAASQKRHPERQRARNQVARAVKAGILVRLSNCERCGASGLMDASHNDYSRPLEVEWLCRPCHVKKDLKTHCKNGHEFTPENTYVDPSHNGTRSCRTCRKVRKAEARVRAKAKAAARAEDFERLKQATADVDRLAARDAAWTERLKTAQLVSFGAGYADAMNDAEADKARAVAEALNQVTRRLEGERVISVYALDEEHIHWNAALNAAINHVRALREAVGGR